MFFLWIYLTYPSRAVHMTLLLILFINSDHILGTGVLYIFKRMGCCSEMTLIWLNVNNTLEHVLLLWCHNNMICYCLMVCTQTWTCKNYQQHELMTIASCQLMNNACLSVWCADHLSAIIPYSWLCAIWGCVQSLKHTTIPRHYALENLIKLVTMHLISYLWVCARKT